MGAQASQRAWSRLQAEEAADDIFHELDGAAEDRRDAAEPPELTIASEISRPVLAPVKPGSIWSARAAAFARCDLSGDHAPGIVSPRRSSPSRGVARRRRRTSGRGYPAADADAGEFIAAHLLQVLAMHDPSHGRGVRPCSREPPRSDPYLGQGQDAHHASMSTCGA